MIFMPKLFIRGIFFWFHRFLSHPAPLGWMNYSPVPSSTKAHLDSTHQRRLEFQTQQGADKGNSGRALTPSWRGHFCSNTLSLLLQKYRSSRCMHCTYTTHQAMGAPASEGPGCCRGGDSIFAQPSPCCGTQDSIPQRQQQCEQTQPFLKPTEATLTRGDRFRLQVRCSPSPR